MSITLLVAYSTLIPIAISLNLVSVTTRGKHSRSHITNSGSTLGTSPKLLRYMSKKVGRSNTFTAW